MLEEEGMEGKTSSCVPIIIRVGGGSGGDGGPGGEGEVNCGGGVGTG